MGKICRRQGRIRTIIVQQPQRVKLKFLHPPETGWQWPNQDHAITLGMGIHREEPGHPRPPRAFRPGPWWRHYPTSSSPHPECGSVILINQYLVCIGIYIARDRVWAIPLCSSTSTLSTTHHRSFGNCWEHSGQLPCGILLILNLTFGQRPPGIQGM